MRPKLHDNLKKYTSKQLIRKAYSNRKDDDFYWECIFSLRIRGTIIEFKEAKKLAYSNNPIYREMSVDILSQFGYNTKINKGECIHLLGRLLGDSAPQVTASAIYGLGYRQAKFYSKKLASLATHSSSDIREALAYALGGFESIESLKALMLLMKDENFETRNWATFSLGTICETNTKVICDALYENLSDIEFEVRGEALLGLALRKDERVKKAIIEDLQADFYGSWIFTSIMEMPDKEYLQYFDIYVDSLDNEDKKAFRSDIEDAKKALEKIR